MNPKNWFRNLRVHNSENSSGLISGLYHFELNSNGNRARVHLRLNPDGRGLLVVNANRIFHLNPTAAFMAYSILNKSSPEIAVKDVQKRYSVSKSLAKTDYENLKNQIDYLIYPTEEFCPVCDLELEINLPFTAKLTAPYRMDCAITYRCNNDCSHCYNARPRNYPELSTQEWKNILDIIWSAGIPHVVFTGGEPTLRDDLPELIAYAEKNGQITGINTNGRRFSDPNFLKELIIAGLDHVQITLESHNPIVHDTMVQCKGAWQQTVLGLKNSLSSPLYVMTNTTLLQSNSQNLSSLLQFLYELKVPTVGLNALIHSGKGANVSSGLDESELNDLLKLAQQITSRNNQKLIWYTPTQYCNFDPTILNLGVKGCSAALYNMCIESDGQVIPCQSYYAPMGNILENSWESIWNHELAVSLRERKYLPDTCYLCSLVKECGGGCPLDYSLRKNYQKPIGLPIDARTP